MALVVTHGMSVRHAWFLLVVLLPVICPEAAAPVSPPPPKAPVRVSSSQPSRTLVRQAQEYCVCNNECIGRPSFASDSICDDGGTGSATDDCQLGTDCEDCGPRCSTLSYPPASPPAPPVHVPPPPLPPPPLPAPAESRDPTSLGPRPMCQASSASHAISLVPFDSQGFAHVWAAPPHRDPPQQRCSRPTATEPFCVPILAAATSQPRGTARGDGTDCVVEHLDHEAADPLG